MNKEQLLPNNIFGLTSIKDAQPSPWRLGIQGAPGTGKTWAALTFPNPIVLDFDNKLAAHYGREDVQVIQFWDQKFIAEYLYQPGKSPPKPSMPPNRRDAIKKWLREQAPLIPAGFTLILDSWTTVQNSFDDYTNADPPMSKKGEIDTFAFWGMKLQYSIELAGFLKGLACNVVVIFHEIADRDDEGRLNGKLKPMMQGQFADQLQAHFTDWYRQHANEKKRKNADGSYSYEGTEYLWQVKADALANCTASWLTTKVALTKHNLLLIPANYNALLEHSGRTQ